MYNVRKEIHASLGHFRMENYWFRYSNFVPRLYNWCLNFGFKPGKIMPARAFCSDESQGFPVILLTKHFGVFPFNHGRVGGIMANGRHGPHANHGEDLLIVQASHVGYDPQTCQFGTFRRTQTEHNKCTSNCGKIHATLDWYLKEYLYARDNIIVSLRDNHCYLTIDNKYLSMSHKDSLILSLRQMIEHHTDGTIIPLSIQSTSRTFKATQFFRRQMEWFFSESDGPKPIGDALLPEYFTYRKDIPENLAEDHQLEYNLLSAMPWIVTSAEPMLTAAQANTQAEFDRSYRILSQEPAYSDRNLIYVCGLHVDISPPKSQPHILNKFIPWAAYIQLKSGERYILEQEELFNELESSSHKNPDQLDFDETIRLMEAASPIDLKLPY
jgi:hypothetical protein